MRGRGRGKLAVGAATFLAALALALTTPAQPEAASAGCGENSGNVCWENESCVDILFFNQCTTDYRYYPKDVDSDVGDADDGIPDTGNEDPSLDEHDDPDDCRWGEDYIGWAPRNCDGR